MLVFMQCVGKAIQSKGIGALFGMVVPFGEHIFEIASEALRNYKEHRRERMIAADIEQLAQAKVEEVRSEARRIAQELATDRPLEEQLKLEAYLSQIPSSIQQTLRRRDDPSGKTVPPGLKFADPSQFASLLPQRLSMFREGDRVPDAPQWVLERMLGSGGFGEVWLATHSFMEEKRAFKFCLDAQARERLLRHEGEIIKRVMRFCKGTYSNFDGIVPLKDAHLGLKQAKNSPQFSWVFRRNFATESRRRACTKRSIVIRFVLQFFLSARWRSA